MEDKNNNLQEQAAPLKNSDQAFVQVGHNGEPVIPDIDKNEPDKEAADQQKTTLDKR